MRGKLRRLLQRTSAAHCLEESSMPRLSPPVPQHTRSVRGTPGLPSGGPPRAQCAPWPSCTAMQFLCPFTSVGCLGTLVPCSGTSSSCCCLPLPGHPAGVARGSGHDLRPTEGPCPVGPSSADVVRGLVAAADERGSSADVRKAPPPPWPPSWAAPRQPASWASSRWVRATTAAAAALPASRRAPHPAGSSPSSEAGSRQGHEDPALPSPRT